MNFNWYTRVLLAVASGAILALAFPNYNFSLLAWIAIGLLTLASCGARLSIAPRGGPRGQAHKDSREDKAKRCHFTLGQIDAVEQAVHADSLRRGGSLRPIGNVRA